MGVGFGSISGLPHKHGCGSVPSIQSRCKATDVPLGPIPGTSGSQEGMFLQLWVHTMLTQEVGLRQQMFSCSWGSRSFFVWAAMRARAPRLPQARSVRISCEACRRGDMNGSTLGLCPDHSARPPGGAPNIPEQAGAHPATACWVCERSPVPFLSGALEVEMQRR